MISNTNKSNAATNCDPINDETDTESIYLLSIESDQLREKASSSEASVHSQRSKQSKHSEQSIKSRQTEKTNPKLLTESSKSLLVRPNKNQHRRSHKPRIEMSEEESASIYQLACVSDSQSEKSNNSEASIHSQRSKQSKRSEQSTKLKQSEEANQQKQAEQNKACPDRTHHQKNHGKDEIEEDKDSVYTLKFTSEKQMEDEELSDKSTHSQRSKQSKISEKSAKQSTENPQKPAPDHQQPHPNKRQHVSVENHACDEEESSEYQLRFDSEPESKPPKDESKKPKDEPKKPEEPPESKIQVREPETPKNSDASPKAANQLRKSTYDRSIFDTPALPTSNGPNRQSKIDYKIRLTVTLKDIGLEGLDSATIDKTQEINGERRKNWRRNRDEEQKIGEEEEDGNSKKTPVGCELGCCSVASSSPGQNQTKCLPKKKIVIPNTKCKKSSPVKHHNLDESTQNSQNTQVIEQNC